MTESGIIGMLHLMGVRNMRVNSAGTGVQADCPFARWRHSDGMDRKPSFSIKIDNSEKSVGYCFACHTSGTLMQIVKDYGDLTYAENVIEYIWENENYKEEYRDKSWGRRLDWKKAKWLLGDEGRGIIAPTPIEEVVFDESKVATIPWDNIERFLKSIPQYVLNRGITKETAQVFRLGYDKRRLSVLMPVIDRKNRLVGITHRAIRPSETLPKYLYNKGFHKMNFLYGENLITQERGDIVLVEGQFDVLKVYQTGLNTAGTIGSYLADIQARKLIELLPRDSKIIIMMDGDVAGKKLTDIAYEKLKEKVPCIKRFVPEGKDPGDLSEKQIIELVNRNELK